MRRDLSRIACGLLVSTSPLLLAAGCGGVTVESAASSGGGAGGATVDGGAEKDAATDASPPPPQDAGTFCTGNKPRLAVNGSDVGVLSVSGKNLALDCCDSAELIVASSMFQALLAVMWRASPLGSTSIDLGAPPPGFTIELDLGCDPATTSCATASPEERYTTGFTGTVEYTQSATGLTASYCLSVAEPAGSPHLVIHSLELYAPGVVSAY